MKDAYDIEKLTAYLLDETDDSEKKEVESILEKDESARKAFEELKQAVELSKEAFAGGAASDLSLSEDQRAVVRKSAKEAPTSKSGEDVGESLFDQPKGGLFEKKEADEPPSPFDFEGSVFASTDTSDQPDHEVPSPFAPVVEEAKPKGEKSESPVLFSLNNLQALAAEPAASSAGSDGSSGEPISPEEASGLIDIRSLAGAIDKEDESDLHELISLEGTGFAQEVRTPVLSTVQSSIGMNIKIVVAVSAAALIAIVLVVVVLATRGGDEKEDRIAKLHAQLEALQNEDADSADVEKLKEEIEDAKESDTEVGSDTSEQEKAEEKKSSKRGSSSRRRGSSSEEESSSSETTSSSEPSSSRGSSELDDLLSGGAPKPSTKKPSSSSRSSSGGGSVKPSLDRADVQKGMNRVAGKVRNCGQGKTGSITVKAVIGTSGQIASAVATGSFAGTPQGSCAARAVKSARFPKSQKQLTVSYPFKL